MRSKKTKRIIEETPQSVKDWVKKYVSLKSMKTENNSVARRHRLDLNTPAELAIYNAMLEVEKAGADRRLTMASIKLQEAKTFVADYIDRINPIEPMTEPIDQATKNLIEKEAEEYAPDEHWINQDSYLGYIAGATVWAGKLKQKEEAIKEKDTWISEERRISTELGNKLYELEEKLRQLETQSHDQVRIIEHLEQELVKERELRKELVDGFLKLFQMELHIPSEHWVEWSEYHKQIESLIKKAKEL